MGVKEFWKNRSYFQKGAIIGIIILAVAILIYFVIIPTYTANFKGEYGCPGYGYYCKGWSYGPICIGEVGMEMWECTTGKEGILCATEVAFNIESVCKSGDGYEISVDNEGKRDIAGWKVRFWQTAKEAEQTDSLRATGAGESKKIIAKPENLTSIRMIELIPLIKTEEKEFRCNQIIESYGNLEGAPITEECNK